MDKLEALMELVEYHKGIIEELKDEIEMIQKRDYKYEVVVPNYMEVDSYGCTKFLFKNKKDAEIFARQGFNSVSEPDLYIECDPVYEEGFDEVIYNFDEAELKEIK